MSVKVYTPGKSAPRVFPNGDSFTVKDGHLAVFAAYDAVQGITPTEALFAPGHWSHATKATSED